MARFNEDFVSLMLSALCLLLVAGQPIAAAQSPDATTPDAGTEADQSAMSRSMELESAALSAEKQELYDAAIRSAEEALEIRGALLPETDAEHAELYRLLGRLYERDLRFDDARRARGRFLDIQIELFGDDDWRVTEARRALVTTDRLEKLTPRQRELMKDARQLSAQSVLAYRRRDYAASQELMRQVLDIYAECMGKDQYLYLYQAFNLATTHRAANEFVEAERWYRVALAGRDQISGRLHPTYARTLQKLAHMYQAAGRPWEAEPLQLECLTICEKLFGVEDRQYLSSLNDLGNTYFELGDLRQSIELHRRCLELRERVYGRDSPEAADSLNNLAAGLAIAGRFTEADRLHRRCLVILEEEIGSRHPSYAVVLANSGALHLLSGHLDEAGRRFREALDVQQSQPGGTPAEIAVTLHDLGDLSIAAGDYEEACQWYQQALALRQDALGKDHPAYLASLNGLAGAHFARGDKEKTESLLLDAWRRRTQTGGQSDLTSTQLEQSLGALYLSTGEIEKAAPYVRRAAEFAAQTYGEFNVNYAKSRVQLAYLHLANGDYDEALPHFREALSITERHLDDAFFLQSERRQILYAQELRSPLDGYLTAASQLSYPVEDIYRRVMFWKGAIARRQNIRTLQGSGDRPQSRVVELQAVRARLAKLSFSATSATDRPSWESERKRLESLKEKLEIELARDMVAETPSPRDLSPSDIAEVLPPGVALVDYFVFRRDFFRRPSEPHRGSQLELLAFVTRRGKNVELIPLGLLQPLEQLVKAWRGAVYEGDRMARDAAAQQLAEAVWKPLRSAVQGTHTVLVSPDGPLWQFPFAALPGQDEHAYLIQDVAIGYVNSAPHAVGALQPSSDANRTRGLMAVGGTASDFQRHEMPETYPGWPVPSAPRTQRIETAKEVHRAVAAFNQRFPGQPAIKLLGSDAREERVRRELSSNRRYIHIATHGFCVAPPDDIPSIRLGTPMPRPFAPIVNNLEDTNALVHSPLLSSAIILASGLPGESGAAGELPNDSIMDGILTAEEMRGFDLRGTQLVVLSACETGLGPVASGDGVMGWQRAFHGAGVETVVASLWTVEDAATLSLMEVFYDNLWGKQLGKLEALRQAQLQMIEHGVGDQAEPYYWATWVLSGDPGDVLLATPPAAHSIDRQTDRQSDVGEPPRLTWRIACLGGAGLILFASLLAWRLRACRQCIY